MPELINCLGRLGICLVTLACAQTGAARDLFTLSPEAVLSKRVQACLSSWRREVIAQDIEAMALRTWPEYAPAVRRSLSKSGPLHAALYEGRQPIVNTLTKTAGNDLIVFEHRMNAQGEYAVGCFALPIAGLEKHTRYVDLQKALSKKDNAFCLSLAFPEPAQCMIDYTFAGELQ